MFRERDSHLVSSHFWTLPEHIKHVAYLRLSFLFFNKRSTLYKVDRWYPLAQGSGSSLCAWLCFEMIKSWIPCRGTWREGLPDIISGEEGSVALLRARRPEQLRWEVDALDQKVRLQRRELFKNILKPPWHGAKVFIFMFWTISLEGYLLFFLMTLCRHSINISLLENKLVFYCSGHYPVSQSQELFRIQRRATQIGSTACRLSGGRDLP